MTEPPAKKTLTQFSIATQDNNASHFSKEWGKTIGRSTISDILNEKDKWVNAGKDGENMICKLLAPEASQH